MAMEEWPHDTQELPQVEGVQPIEGATGSPDWTPGRHHLLQHPFLRILMASCVLISIVTVAQSGLHILRGLLPLVGHLVCI
jgi:hypothetical protein